MYYGRNEDTNQEEGEEMSKHVLSMILFGGLTLGGLLGGGLIGGCGEDGDSPLPSEREGQGEGESEGSPNEGEGEGSSSEGEGEGEGEGMGPPGADGEPCGDGNTCQDGLECGAEEAGICTCPQWFEGRWMVEYTNVRAVDYEYDFTAGSGDRELWGDRGFEIQQNGCALVTTERNTALRGGDGVSGGQVNPPDGFRYRSRTRSVDAGDRWNEWVGLLSPDRRIITGTCDGEYADGMKEPAVWFHITCTFTLTRR